MTEKRGPGRPKKASDRRRKAGIHGRGRQKLTTPEIAGFTTRWVNDIANRIHEKTKEDDWDFVSASEIDNEVGEDGDGNQDLGSNVKRAVGTYEGKPLYAYLLKKPLKYYEEDLANNEEARRAKEDTLRRGTGDDGQPVSHQYGSIK